jgi:diguanylate cyclase (GGDEF)-like protein
VSQNDYEQGHHPDMIPVQDLGEPVQMEGDPVADGEEVEVAPNNKVALKPPSVFEYQKVGFETPHIVEFYNGQATMNGHLLTPEELARIHQNVRNGTATLKYRPQALESFLQMQKSEQAFKALAKADPSAGMVLPQLDAPPEARVERPEHHIDRMTGLGNLGAFAQFMALAQPGAHVRIDANDTSGINQAHGFEVGSKAIKAIADAVKSFLPKDGNAFRIGGDEFHAHLPTHDHALQFVRDIRNALSDMPAIGGTHKISVSMGIGSSPDEAEKGLHKAKSQKHSQNYQKGQAETHVYNHVPGQEGHVPVADPKALPSFKE